MMPHEQNGHPMSNSVLFQPFALHDLTLPNRIVLAPMTRSRAGIARLPNTLMAEYYCQRSSAGLLVTEATTISGGERLERVAGRLHRRDDRGLEAHHRGRA